MIAVSVTLILKITGLSKILAQKMFKANCNKVIGGVDRTNKIIVDLSKSKKLKKIKTKI